MKIAAFGRGRVVDLAVLRAFPPRIQAARILAANIGAGAKLNADVEIKAFAPTDIRAKQPKPAAFLQYPLKENPTNMRIHPEDRQAHAARPAHSRQWSYHRKQDRANGEQNPILKCSRFSLVGITDDMVFVGDGLAAELPFKPVGNPAPPRPRSFALDISSITFSGRRAKAALITSPRSGSPDKSGPGCTRLDRTVAFGSVAPGAPRGGYGGGSPSCPRCRKAATICGASPGVSEVRIIPFMRAAGS